MKNKKRGAGFLIVLIMMIMNSGCYGQNSLNVQKKLTVDVILKSSDNDFWQTVRAGAVDAGKEFGIDISFNSPLNENNIDDQIKLVNTAIDDKVDAIVLAAADYKRLVEVSEKAIDKGIPIIIVDSTIDSNRVSSVIATDNREAARKAGDILTSMVKGKANLGIVSFVKGAASSDDREAGIYDAIGNYHNIKVIDKIYTNSDETMSEELTKNMLKQHNEIDAIVALNGPSTTGAARAIKELKLEGKVKVIGFDNTIGEIDYLEDGIIQDTVIQNPYSMGYLGVKHAYDVINKISIPKTINTGSTVIDKKNMYLPENEKLLFPFVK